MFRRKRVDKLFSGSYQSYDIINNIVSLMLNEGWFKWRSNGYRKRDKVAKIKCKFARKENKSLTEVG